MSAAPGAEHEARQRAIERKFLGYPVIDGDETEARFKDRKGSIVAHRRCRAPNLHTTYWAQLDKGPVNGVRSDRRPWLDQRLTNRRSAKFGEIRCMFSARKASSRGSIGVFVFRYFSVKAPISRF